MQILNLSDLTGETRETVDPFINQSNQGDQMDQDGKSWVEIFGGKYTHWVFEALCFCFCVESAEEKDEGEKRRRRNVTLSRLES